MDEFNGIVFYRRKYREHDLLIKMLTDDFGKHTFFVGHAHQRRYHLNYGLQDFTAGSYAGRISNHGFSFINEVNSADLYSSIYSDLDKSSYVQYIFSLIDSAFEDNLVIPAWFRVLKSTLNQIEKNANPETMSHAFELKLLSSFGVNFNFFSCAVCGREDLPLDLSFKFNGMLCQNHQDQDKFRFHLDQRMVKCLQVLTVGSIESLSKMQIDPKNMKVLRNTCDEIYSNYIGIYPKTKSFIDKLNNES
ncbi:DNA repair protein RecO [Xylocopilactobacillus apicola]|uniref:DNA repair protein RecO n=1 Tax=Xylocopilactobacillus apicola TaxID=2932184 RepID=A0AAU9D1N4_9LACO|nr:DNA repair protein RecO [Xylocopilactobacillus apicola]BDR58626.1 DNA repair protein RecO [Xylocopilactobacillus apicola]